MVLGSNPSTNDILNLLNIGCCGVVGTLRFGSPWRVLRAYPWKAPWLSKKKVCLCTQYIYVYVYTCIYFLKQFLIVLLYFLFFFPFSFLSYEHHS